MPQEGLAEPTQSDAISLAYLIERSPDANSAAKDFAVELRIRPSALSNHFLADAEYLAQIYSSKVSTAERGGLQVRGSTDLPRIAARGDEMLRLSAGSDDGWHYQAFTDR